MKKFIKSILFMSFLCLSQLTLSTEESTNKLTQIDLDFIATISSDKLKDKVKRFITFKYDIESIIDIFRYDPIIIYTIFGSKDEQEALRLTQTLIENYKANVNAHMIYGTSLLAAIARDYTEVVKLLLKSKVDIEVNNEHFASALISAVNLGNIEITKLLLQAGIDLENKDNRVFDRDGKVIELYRRGATALIYAAHCNNIEMVKILLEKNANPNATNKGDHTPLMMAITNGNIEMAKLLLSKGANINAKDFHGFTALAYAISNKNTEAVNFLLTNNANANISGYYKGQTPLMLSCKTHDFRIARLILNKYPKNTIINDGDIAGNTALIYSAYCNNIAAVKFLLANGADITRKNDDGKTAKDIAQEKGYKEIVKLLS